MSLRILHIREDAPVSAPQKLGPYQIESLIPREDEAAGTAYRVRIEPHSTTAVSYHKVAEEIYYVLEGNRAFVRIENPGSSEPGTRYLPKAELEPVD